MDSGINFYELKMQLSDMGFQEHRLVDLLRNAILNNVGWAALPLNRDTLAETVQFSLNFEKDQHDYLGLVNYDAVISPKTQPDRIFDQVFEPQVPATEAIQLLQTRVNSGDTVAYITGVPMSRREVTASLSALHRAQNIISINQINQSNMNTQNLEFLKKSLLNLGFGEQVNAELEKNINKKTPEFSLPAQHEFNQQKAEYNLHFKAGENQEMYFFNKFDANLNKGKETEQNQTFYINKGNGVTAKEAFNLMEGRAVHKQLFNKEGEKYYAWLQLDDQNLTQNGNKEIKRFSENYGFNLDDVLSGKGIKEMKTAEGQENLMRSLKKGNTQQVTVERDGAEKKYFIAASPQFKTVDLFDHQMKKIKREELLQPEQKQSNGQKQGKQQKEELPGKKQQKKSKLSV